MPEEKGLSRRRFLQFTGMAAGAAATLGMAAVSVAADSDNAAHAGHTAGAGQADTATQPLSRGRMFVTNDRDFSTLSAAAERIFPQDETGPGAKALAVPYFIDNQLAGAYGYNAREYTGGPYFAGAPTQGYQTPVLRRDIFLQGVQALNATAQTRYKKDFAQLSGAEQDAILVDCEAGKIPMPGFSSSYFFSLLKGAVLAGAYADPIYNGNNNMDGWRMKDYPGAQMSYLYLITDDTFDKVDPVSLSSMQ